MEKDVVNLKSVVISLIASGETAGNYSTDFVKRILRNAKSKRGSVRYTNKVIFVDIGNRKDIYD